MGQTRAPRFRRGPTLCVPPAGEVCVRGTTVPKKSPSWAVFQVFSLRELTRPQEIGGALSGEVWGVPNKALGRSPLVSNGPKTAQKGPELAKNAQKEHTKAFVAQ